MSALAGRLGSEPAGIDLLTLATQSQVDQFPRITYTHRFHTHELQFNSQVTLVVIERQWMY